MIVRSFLACLVAVALSVAPAHADDFAAYPVEGGASTAAADPRTDALDDAFARATAAALAELVPAELRASRKADLDREIVGHARLWVAKFSVTKDEVTDDRRILAVSVRIDRDKLRAQLAKLQIAAQDVAPVDAAPVNTHTAVVLIAVTQPSGVRADFGAAAQSDVPGLAAATKVLRAAGYAVRRAPQTGEPKPGELPLDDDAASALASDAQAEVVVVIGVAVGPSAPVRGLAANASLVTANTRAFTRKDKRALVADATITRATAASSGDDAGAIAYAIDRAIAGALADALPAASTQLAHAAAFRGDDHPIAEPGVVLVRIPAKTPMHLVLDEQKYLAGARGVHGATLRRLSPGGWVLGVTTGESIERIAQLAKRPPTADSTASVRIEGDVIELALGGAP